MTVVDTSALVHILAARPANARLEARLLREDRLHAPHLVDIEVLQALRGLVLRGEITTEQADIARARFDELSLARFPHGPTSVRIWELRENLTAYDAAYVALAEALDAPLVTTDEKLARAPGHIAEIELFSIR